MNPSLSDDQKIRFERARKEQRYHVAWIISKGGYIERSYCCRDYGRPVETKLMCFATHERLVCPKCPEPWESVDQFRQCHECASDYARQVLAGGGEVFDHRDSELLEKLGVEYFGITETGEAR
jgi:hypothetical protein